MSIGEKLAELRVDKGLLQKELASMLNVTPSSVSNYETDTYKPDIDNLVKLADIFESSTDYILDRIRYNVDMTSFEKKFSELDKKPVTFGSLMERLNMLKPESRKALLEYVRLLEIKENAENKYLANFNILKDES